MIGKKQAYPICQQEYAKDNPLCTDEIGNKHVRVEARERKDSRIGLVIESFACFFMCILVFAQLASIMLYGNYGAVGDAVFVLGAFGLFAYITSLLFMPNRDDIYALGIGFTFAVIVVAIFIPEASLIQYIWKV